MSLTLFFALLQTLWWLQPCQAHLRCGQRPLKPDYVLIATMKNISIACQQRSSVLLNGTSPGPPLYLKENSTTFVRVYNHIPKQNLTVHWHGLSQRTAIFSDGTPMVSQWPIASGEFFDYEISPDVGDAGTYFYHSHVGFQAITATGPLLVRDLGSPPYQHEKDVTIMVQDFYPQNDSTVVSGLLADPFHWPGEPKAILINGQSGNGSVVNSSDATCASHIININPGETIRMRFIGATSISFVTLGIEAHEELTIIEADGAYTKPWNTDHLQVASGQRFSILLKAKTMQELQALNKNTFWIRYENRNRPSSISGYAILRYNVPNNNLPQNFPTKPPITLPQDVTAWAEYALENIYMPEPFPKLSEVTRTVYITTKQVVKNGFILSNGTLNAELEWAQDNLVWQTESREANNSLPYLVQIYQTGQSPNYTAAVQNGGWDPYSNTFPALPGETLDIVWQSDNGPLGGWDFHPFHAHGKHYFDLGGGNHSYNAVENEKRFANYTPARRDTTIMHRYATSGVPNTTSGWRAWRIRMTEDNVGAWMVHCHILLHMTMGMQTIWVVGNTSDILARYPTEPYVQGYLTYGGDAYGNSTWDPLVDYFGTKG